MEHSNLNNPYCAIGMVTYNHEKYIEQAIESVMMQEAGFSYKLFIGEDCSTDNTRALCIQMKQKYPDKIELILNEKNLGQGLNGYNLYKIIMSSGVKYSSILDGDDYWTDKLKLQKQVDILEKNVECSVCFTHADLLNEGTNQIVRGKDSMPQRLSFDTYMEKGMPYTTCTALYRADRMPKTLGDWFSKSIKQDWAAYVLMLHTGDAYYLPETTAVYRVHGRGVIKSTPHIVLAENSINLVWNIRQYFYPDHHQAFDKILTWSYYNLAFDYWNMFKIGHFFKNIQKAAQSGEKKSLRWYWNTIKKMVLDMLRKVYHKIRG